MLVVEKHPLTQCSGDTREKRDTWSGFQQGRSASFFLGSAVQVLPVAGRALSGAFWTPEPARGLGSPRAPPAAGCVRPGGLFNLPVASFPHLLRGDNVFEDDLPPRQA